MSLTSGTQNSYSLKVVLSAGIFNMIPKQFDGLLMPETLSRQYSLIRFPSFVELDIGNGSFFNKEEGGALHGG